MWSRNQYYVSVCEDKIFEIGIKWMSLINITRISYRGNIILCKGNWAISLPGLEVKVVVDLDNVDSNKDTSITGGSLSVSSVECIIYPQEGGKGSKSDKGSNSSKSSTRRQGSNNGNRRIHVHI